MLDDVGKYPIRGMVLISSMFASLYNLLKRLQQRFPNVFGHGTHFNLVNIYGTHMFCDPAFIK